MTTLQKSSNLLTRSLFVVLGGAGFIAAFFIGFSGIFQELSIFAAVVIAAGSVIIFGWGCYLGYIQRREDHLSH